MVQSLRSSYRWDPMPFGQLLLHITVLAVLTGCTGSSGGSTQDGGCAPSRWATLRAAAQPQVALPDEFGIARVQPLAVDGWEDGIFISRDGLHLFAVYAPADLLSFTLAGADQLQGARYRRGPDFGMDLLTNPTGAPHWIQGDIITSERASLAEPFTAWRLSAMARPVYSEGAVVAQGSTTAGWALFAYTANDQAPDYLPHIVLARDVPLDPPVSGIRLPAPVTTSHAEDNPHIERIDVQHLVLFFDSGDRPGGVGGLDLWWCESTDDGASWSTPLPVASLNTAVAEHQPHLFRDHAGIWWLYYTATNPADGKLGIFRARQGAPDSWDAWTDRQLVVGAGNTAGVGEPTLTAAGDLSFVVVMEDTAQGTPTNRFDADPWFLPRRPSGIARQPDPGSNDLLAEWSAQRHHPDRVGSRMVRSR